VTPEDTASFRCGAPPRVRAMLYHALAHGLVNAQRPAGAVFEAVASDPVPIVTVRPARVLDELRGAPRGSYDPIEFRATPRSPRPPRGTVDRVGVVFARPPSASWTAEEVPMRAPPLDRLLGPAGWLAFQTFWVQGTRGQLCVARRFRYALPDPSQQDARFASVAAAVAYDWSNVTRGAATVRRAAPGARIGWRHRTLRTLPRGAWVARGPESVEPTAEVRWVGLRPSGDPPAGHAVVFGSSGAGKTSYLAHRAAEAVAAGQRVVAIDLHGDLAPAVVAHLAPEGRSRVVAVDASERPVTGISVLSGAGGDDRAAAVLVAAIKRLSADGTDVYWGFRLERIFDTFVRLVQESGGSLLDLYDLLTSDDRRDSARLSTRRPELARFLEELGPVVRRSPDFLWSAATRLSKVVLVPALAELLAPAGGGLPVEELVSEGRSLLVRLPFARLGPEAATLAGTLILARVFLGLAGRERIDPNDATVLLVLDEVHGFSPRLVAEVLAESRKFGVRAIVATQYPERLAPEVRSAAAGASTHFVAFRVPPPSAAEAGSWLGLDRPTAERLLPVLPPGRGVELDPETGTLHPLAPAPLVDPRPGPGWSEVVARTRSAYGSPGGFEAGVPAGDAATERLLLAVLAAEEEGHPLDAGGVVPAALALPGAPVDGATLADGWETILRREWVTAPDQRCHLSAAGARWLGLGTPTGAARETAEHRRLLLRTFRIFARRGYRLEILRQGRFDTTLPDARFRQLSTPGNRGVPVELAREVDRARLGWAWRFFGGRDVHVEAEVSGALRPERVRHGWSKVAGRGGFVLFVVGDPVRARRVKSVLERLGVGRDRAQVWTLPPVAEPKQ
jgi:hypothetical protein